MKKLASRRKQWYKHLCLSLALLSVVTGSPGAVDEDVIEFSHDKADDFGIDLTKTSHDNNDDFSGEDDFDSMDFEKLELDKDETSNPVKLSQAKNKPQNKPVTTTHKDNKQANKLDSVQKRANKLDSVQKLSKDKPRNDYLLKKTVITEVRGLSSTDDVASLEEEAALLGEDGKLEEEALQDTATVMMISVGAAVGAFLVATLGILVGIKFSPGFRNAIKGVLPRGGSRSRGSRGSSSGSDESPARPRPKTTRVKLPAEHSSSAGDADDDVIISLKGGLR